MENKDLNVKPELEIVRFAPGDFFHKSLDEHELPGVPI